MTSAIELRGLTKTYHQRRGQFAAVAGLDLDVPTGGVFGFLGPNGAGKTTTIRALVGLLRPSSGSIRVLGQDVPGGLGTVIDRIGALVETPSFYPAFSGEQNLELLARSRRIARGRVADVLATVGLTERADSKVQSYSLGMRQRLAVAAVLLKDPELLILDEPANGLDPAGIHEVRVLLRRLGNEGRTVFVSSHILAEIEQTCDRVAVLARGRCVASGPVTDLLAGGTGARTTARLDPAAMGGAVAALAAAGFTAVAESGGVLSVEVGADQAAAVNRVLGSAGVWVSELRPVERSLEEAFLELTTPDPAAAAPPPPPPPEGQG